MKHEKLVLPSDPILRQKCKAIEPGTDLTEIVKEMFEVVGDIGVGLAAPQIGKNIRLFIVHYNGIDRVFVNPKIINKLGNIKKDFESCLSLPGIAIPVLRNSVVLVEFYDEYWVRHKEVFSDFIARIIQHEQDHLNGKLIIDYNNPI